MSSDGPTGRFLRSDRLLDSRDFRRVLRRGRRRAAPELVVVTAPRASVPASAEDPVAPPAIADHPPSRLGITASRKVGNAVVRNRFKRRVREWFRHHRSGFPKGIDLVVIARREGAELPYAALSDRLDALLGIGPRPGAPS